MRQTKQKKDIFLRFVCRNKILLLTFATLVPAKPLVDAQMRGAFLFVDMARRNFTKTYSSPTDLVQILKSRGLEIRNERNVEQYIESIGYYRLSAYMYPFLKMPKNLHQYKTGASFKKDHDVISL